MFCEEPIIAVYEGCRKYDDIQNAESFFDCFHDLAYHVTIGYRIVLETEHFYISLSSAGVTATKKIQSIEEFQENGECLNSFIHTDLGEEDESPWVDYEATLFIGERLKDVKFETGIFLIEFDHFQLKIIPHDLKADDVPSLRNMNHGSYNHVYGLERFIKRKCSCGGDGELLLDFVSDYVVRCKKCKKSTCAEMNAIDAITDWESGEIYCDCSAINIE